MNYSNIMDRKLLVVQLQNGTTLLNLLNSFLSNRNGYIINEEPENDIKENVEENTDDAEEEYDHEGAAYFIVIVVLFYALGIVFLILSLSRRTKEDTEDYIREHRKLVQKAKEKQKRTTKYQARLNISGKKLSSKSGTIKSVSSYSDITDFDDDDHSLSQATPSPKVNGKNCRFFNEMENNTGIEMNKDGNNINMENDLSTESRYFTYNTPKNHENDASFIKQPLIIPKLVITHEWMDEAQNDSFIINQKRNGTPLPSPGFLSPLTEMSDEDDNVFLP